MSTETIDNEIIKVIERLDHYGSTTCSDNIIRHFGRSDEGRDNLVRYFREKFNTKIWLKICNDDDRTPIITKLDNFDTDKSLGYSWSVKDGRIQ